MKHALSMPFALAALLLAVGLLGLPGCDDAPEKPAPTQPAATQPDPTQPAAGANADEAPAQPAANDAPKVAVHVFDKKGKLRGPITMPAVRLSEQEWRKRLTDEQFRILRKSGTERAFCGTLLDNKQEGVYCCAGCALPLFSSDAKFKSGTGWPSFFQPVAKPNIEERADNSYGMRRVEILCARCEGHLGHVFRDGPEPTGLRYCLNSESLTFTNSALIETLADPYLEANPEKPVTDEPTYAKAIFAGGCFWCVEAVFEELEGVKDAISGYTGGKKETANYEAVCSGMTKHAEAVQILYDPKKITYAELLDVHFATHDPTTLNRQGYDEGPQYRSAIFYANDDEKKAAQEAIKRAQAQIGVAQIVTTLEKLDVFYEAELKHQNFVCENPYQRYVQAVALPKVKKVRAKFKDKLKEKSPLEREE